MNEMTNGKAYCFNRFFPVYIRWSLHVPFFRILYTKDTLITNRGKSVDGEGKKSATVVKKAPQLCTLQSIPNWLGWRREINEGDVDNPSDAPHV